MNATHRADRKAHEESREQYGNSPDTDEPPTGLEVFRGFLVYCLICWTVAQPTEKFGFWLCSPATLLLELLVLVGKLSWRLFELAGPRMFG